MAFQGSSFFIVNLAAAVLFATAAFAAPTLPAADGTTSCGNGILDAGEECDSGSSIGTPECNTLCERTAYEPFGLPFGEMSSPDLPDNVAAIFAPSLQCKDPAVREGARNKAAVTVRYRIHLCRSSLGLDSFTEAEVRSVMAKAAAEFAEAGIVLEEESLVRFSDKDCLLSMDDSGWTDALADATPDGVLALSFVKGISSGSTQFAVGGFCYFFGPICVNAGAYETLVVHELGHFFGLAHTFECAWGSETTSTCGTSGDFTCDTPPDRGPWGVNGIAQCKNGQMLNGSCSGSCANKSCSDGSKPDAYDWMSYYHCTPGHFSNEQLDFMRCTLDRELKNYNAGSTRQPQPDCGDLNEDGELTASDALGVLRAGVGSIECEEWLCDYDGSGKVSASDALAVLRAAIGTGEPAHCPAP